MIDAGPAGSRPGDADAKAARRRADAKAARTRADAIAARTRGRRESGRTRADGAGRLPAGARPGRVPGLPPQAQPGRA